MKQIIIKFDRFDIHSDAYEVVRVESSGAATVQIFRGSLQDCRQIAMPYVLLGYDVSQEDA